MALTGDGARSRPGTSPIALAAIALGAMAAATALAARASQVWQEGVATIDQGVELVVEAGATVCAGWIAFGAVVGLLLTVVRRAGRDWRAGRIFLSRCAPRLVRRLAGVVATAGVGIGLTAPAAFATTGPGPETDPVAARPDVVLDLGWHPTSEDGLVGGDIAAPAARLAGPGALAPGFRDTDAGSSGVPDPERVPHVDRKLRDGGPREHDVPVIVRHGDTLWSIAAGHLEPDDPVPGTEPPDAARIADEVDAWHTVNRDAIGSDPDLIRPGTVLHAPDTSPVGATP